MSQTVGTLFFYRKNCWNSRVCYHQVLPYILYCFHFTFPSIGHYQLHYGIAFKNTPPLQFQASTWVSENIELRWMLKKLNKTQNLLLYILIYHRSILLTYLIKMHIKRCLVMTSPFSQISLNWIGISIIVKATNVYRIHTYNMKVSTKRVVKEDKISNHKLEYLSD